RSHLIWLARCMYLCERAAAANSDPVQQYALPGHVGVRIPAMRRVAIICLGIGVVLAVAGWLYVQDVRAHSVERALAEQAKLGPGTVVDFAEIAPFEWDRVYVFGPYTPEEHIQKCLGFEWESAGRSSINSSKRANLVVFVRGSEVVHSFDQARSVEL